MIALLISLFLQAVSTPAGSISGNVIDAGRQYVQPLFDARVELIRDSGSASVLRTDENGRFSYENLRPGRYRIFVARDGFIRKSATIDLAAGQQRKDIVVALDIAPTLFGRIHDPSNVPIANILVEAVKVVYGPRGDRSVMSVESALTDDRGEYHLYWLDPGEYYIRASLLVQKDSPGPAYAPTYFPGFRDPKDAARISLRVGSNLSAFDFRLQATSTVDLWGHISIEATGESVGTAISAIPEGAVASVRKFEGRSISPGPGVSVRDVGEFKLGGMSPGSFVVSAQYSVGGQQLNVHRKVTLKGPEHAFILQLSPGITVNGRIVAAAGPKLDLRSARVILESIDPDLPSPRIAMVDANGQFAVARVEPGDYAIRAIDLPGDIYMKSAHSGDLDILIKPLHVEYSVLEPISIDLGVDGGRLDGTVMDSADRPFAGADVVIVPDGSRRNSPNQYRVAASDGDGHFTLHGIPPGEYKLFAWQNMESNSYLNPAYLESYEDSGLKINIPPGSIGSTSVRVIPLN